MTVRDGYYEYNIKFSTLLRTADDVGNIYLRKNDRIFQLKNLARISVVPEKETGASLSNGKRAVTLAIIKQADENMIGKADINSLTLSLNRQQEAQRNYISALQNYWLSYYKIRKLTLFDFSKGQSLLSTFDYNSIL